MPFTCGTIDEQRYKIYMRDVMRSYVREIVEKDIRYAYEICSELDPEWTFKFQRKSKNILPYKINLVDFIMSFYDKVNLKDYV